MASHFIGGCYIFLRMLKRGQKMREKNVENVENVEEFFFAHK